MPANIHFPEAAPQTTNLLWLIEQALRTQNTAPTAQAVREVAEIVRRLSYNIAQDVQVQAPQNTGDIDYLIEVNASTIAADMGFN